MEPHPELIERERETDAVQNRRLSHSSRVRPDEDEIRAHAAQNEDSVIEMVDVGLPESQVEVVQPADRHEEHDGARERERDDEGHEHAPGQARRAHVLLLRRDLVGSGSDSLAAEPNLVLFGHGRIVGAHNPMLAPRLPITRSNSTRRGGTAMLPFPV